MMHAPRRYITAAAVAELLGYGSVAYFKRVHRGLERQGFPPPAKRCPLMWDPAAIAVYQNAQLPSSPASTADDELKRWGNILDQRLGG